MTTSATTAPGQAGLVALEIRHLRKGAGLQAAQLDRRLGPLLRELASGAAGSDAAGLRQGLAAELGARAARLLSEPRTAVLAGLALTPETRQMPYFRDRVRWLAAEIGYESRTALRRIDAAEVLLSEEIAHELLRRRERTAAGPPGWYLDQLATVLRLDTPAPEAHERRRIVATRDGLTEVMAWLDAPPVPGRPGIVLSAEVLYGGRLLRRRQPSQNRIEMMLALPRPLKAGEVHEYGLVLRVAEGKNMRPHYIFTPECRCNIFDLRVQFDPAHYPAWVRRVQGETVRTFDAPVLDADRVLLDDTGQLHLQFYCPELYLGYGAQWQP